MRKTLFLVSTLLFSGSIFATPVNINIADAATISASLSGVGPKKAEAIVADREKNGPFKSAEDLKRVSGIGDKIVSTNKNDILLEAPKPATPATSASAAPATPAASAPATPAAPAKAPEVKK